MTKLQSLFALFQTRLKRDIVTTFNTTSSKPCVILVLDFKCKLPLHVPCYVNDLNMGNKQGPNIPPSTIQYTQQLTVVSETQKAFLSKVAV